MHFFRPKSKIGNRYPVELDELNRMAFFVFSEYLQNFSNNSKYVLRAKNLNFDHVKLERFLCG